MQQTIKFGGDTFNPVLDSIRLSAQLRAVFLHMEKHANEYWSLSELSAVLGYPEASISARLRDLRKPIGGCHIIARRRRTIGTWEYALIRSPA